MKNSNIDFGTTISVPFFLLMMLFSITCIVLPSCDKLDDVPPPSAYVPPEPDTTGACVFLNVLPELSGDTAIDFECEGPEYTFFGEKESSIVIEYADNPATGGINASERVVQVTQSPDIEPWAGLFFDLSTKIDFSVFQDIKIKVYSPAADQMINLKLEDSSDGSISTEIAVSTTVANEWEELCFPFSTGDTDKFDRFVLFFDFQGPKDAETIHYFDDIILGEGCEAGSGSTSSAVPTEAAPSPRIAEDKVISLFSNAYTDVPVDTWLTEWSAGMLLDTTIAEDDVKKYSELSFAGIETVANQIDISEMTHFHTDIWTANATEIKVKIVDFGPDGAFDGGDDTEHEVVIASPALEEWVSLDLPLSDFTGLTTRGNIAQFIYSAAPGGEATVFMDNIFFYDSEGLFTAPTTAAPNPTQSEMNVISMFSDAYTNVPVDTWRTDWSAADFEEVDIMGSATLKYSNLNFVGAETVMNQIDVSGMTHFHVDVWTPDATTFRIKMVDFGPDGGFDGGDDTEHELVFENPAQGEWISLDIPMADFVNMTTRQNIAQLIFSGLPSGEMTLFVDNVYFYEEMAAPTEPTIAAPTPMQNEMDVISMFSDAYTNVPVDTWRTDWSAADFEEVDIMGSATLKYSNLNFVGAETVMNQIDVSGMTHFHMDVWTPDATTFRIKMVDFGPDGGFDGGDDTEHELVFENPTQGQWISLDIPMADFVNMTTRQNIAQLIFSGLPTGEMTLFVDNVYFYEEMAAPTEPTGAAPTPTQNAMDVISMFSDTYTNVPVDTWRTDWSAADFEEVDIMGSATLKYSNLNFVGAETVMNQIDVSGMTHFHVDVWTPDATTFRIKMVDFGPDGGFDGGDDTEHELVFENPAQGQWISLDIPMVDFVNLTTRQNISQLIFSGLPTGAMTLFVDNVYFYQEMTTPTEPTGAAPTPTLDEADVISLFSDAYTNVPVDTWRTDWSAADFEEVDIMGSATLKYSNLNFVGAETVMNQIDVSGMTHFHVDVWTPDATTFRIKMVDFGPDGGFDGGDDTEHELVFDDPAQGQWISLDIPIADFVNLTTQQNIAQLIFSGLPTGEMTLFVDNVYFHK